MFENTVTMLCGMCIVALLQAVESKISDAKCVSDFVELEEKTFVNSTANRYKVYQAFYPPNGHLPYSVEVTYNTVLPNGSRVVVVAQASEQCNITRWLWLSSPVFLYMRPEYLNRIILYTLNYFNPWHPPQIVLEVPQICSKETEMFLLQMTSSLQDYAVGQLKMKTDSGNVVVHCDSYGDLSFYHLPLSGHRSTQITQMDFNRSKIALGVGGIMQILLQWGILVAILKKHLNHYIEQSLLYSYKYYGIMCGTTTICFLLAVTITYFTADTSLISHPHSLYDKAYNILGLAMIGLCILPGIPLAVFFACRTKPPAVPYVFVIPVTVLLCCGSVHRAKSFTFMVGLWSILSGVQLIAAYCTVAAFTLLAEPYAIITNSLLIIIVFICMINISAVLFTVCAHFCTPSSKRWQGAGDTMKRALLLVPLLTVTCCYCSVFITNGYVINIQNKQTNIRSLMSSFAIPLILGVITFGLNRVIMTWLVTPQVNTEITKHTEGNLYEELM